MTLHADVLDPVATCKVGDCRWHAHADSADDAALAWTAHLAAVHRGDWDDDTRKDDHAPLAAQVP